MRHATVILNKALTAPLLERLTAVTSRDLSVRGNGILVDSHGNGNENSLCWNPNVENYIYGSQNSHCLKCSIFASNATFDIVSLVNICWKWERENRERVYGNSRGVKIGWATPKFREWEWEWPSGNGRDWEYWKPFPHISTDSRRNTHHYHHHDKV